MQAIFGLELLARTRVHPRRINRLAVGAHDEQPLGRAVEFAKPDGQTAHIHAVVLVAERAGSRIRRYRVAARDATSDVTGALGEMYGAAQSVKVAGAERRMIDHFA